MIGPPEIPAPTILWGDTGSPRRARSAPHSVAALVQSYDFPPVPTHYYRFEISKASSHRTERSLCAFSANVRTAGLTVINGCFPLTSTPEGKSLSLMMKAKSRPSFCEIWGIALQGKFSALGFLGGRLPSSFVLLI